jgi:hypothetical protein
VGSRATGSANLFSPLREILRNAESLFVRIYKPSRGSDTHVRFFSPSQIPHFESRLHNQSTPIFSSRFTSPPYNMSIPGMLPGMGANNQMQGMNENEQWMIKMVRFFLSGDIKSTEPPLMRAIDAKWNGVLSREDSHGRYNGFRSGWCFRSLHGQCKISPLSPISLPYRK